MNNGADMTKWKTKRNDEYIYDIKGNHPGNASSLLKIPYLWEGTKTGTPSPGL